MIGSEPVPVLLALTTLFFIAPSVAAGQDATPVYVDGGVTLPLGDFGDGWNMGLNFGGGAMFPLGSGLVLRAHLCYSQFTFNEEGLFARAGVPDDDGVEVTGGELGAFSALALLQRYLAPPERSFRPYLLGGAGYWRTTIEDLTVSSPGFRRRSEGYRQRRGRRARRRRWDVPGPLARAPRRGTLHARVGLRRSDRPGRDLSAAQDRRGLNP